MEYMIKDSFNKVLFNAALWLLEKTPFILLNDKATITLLKPDVLDGTIPNPKNHKRRILRDRGGKFTSIKNV